MKTPEEKATRRDYMRAWREAHPDQVREANRKWREEHPDRAKEAHRKYRAAHLAEEREKGRKWRAEHPEQKRETHRQWRETHPERIKEIHRKSREKCYEPRKARNDRLKRRYGITDGCEQLLFDQGSICAICDRLLEHKFDVDHDHATGWVRGLLCPDCNQALGLLRDSTETLRTMILYLEKHSPVPMTSPSGE